LQFIVYYATYGVLAQYTVRYGHCVCLSHDCIKTVGHIIKLFSPRRSPVTLVLSHQTSRNFNDAILNVSENVFILRCVNAILIIGRRLLRR